MPSAEVGWKLWSEEEFCTCGLEMSEEFWPETSSRQKGALGQRKVPRNLKAGVRKRKHKEEMYWDLLFECDHRQSEMICYI